MADPPTIIAKKLSFLTHQTRLLTTPDPLPTRAWRRSNASSESPLPQRAVDDALAKLTQVLRQHARRVYPPQAARHVAEQVERLYWEDAERKAEGIGGDGIGREVDLADESVIARLPPIWPSDEEAEAHPAEAHRYTAQIARLSTLADERRELRQRVQRLRRMQELLRPFETSFVDERGRESTAGVQESLLTRRGPMEKELDRMRLLLLRVSARLGAVDDGTATEAKRVRDILGADEERIGRVLKDL
ncbi:hypothetical protein jhhlp_006083 [Lomentospora prolificans]|uniref:Kinetochore protein fta4 n=1 Tax=Lomentospora prolificans TaxID=41688 RepID=A0A2N3N4W6_9PEZI|nr:hypothetical protein jhhlp_006083 [Lomentospora prolificans]